MYCISNKYEHVFLNFICPLKKIAKFVCKTECKQRKIGKKSSVVVEINAKKVAKIHRVREKKCADDK